MHERAVELGAERRLVEVGLAAAEDGSAGLAIGPDLHDAVRGPGTEPRTKQVLLGVDLHDLEAALGARLLPIWPGIFWPGSTRDGVADAPIEPIARTLCEPCETGPREKPWRLMPPWKPLPLEMPATLTFWPGSNASTVTVSPTWQLAGLVAELHEVLHGRARRPS